ncbi:uncharacterized protein LOC122005704 isoform X1 [Zingiber officinale]|uniref:uncharacterized protein LOC122005704 isoform X1 n=1 Tax=Zingiber officinale TaxID=94328 RepID=UPI001C4A91F5|nr:uncharacterized protein LOC122005704 isoform X1 [Zingiber officinale]
MMALMTTIAVGPKLPLQITQSLFHQVSRTFESVAVCNAWESQRLLFPYGRDSRNWPWSVHAVGPGLEASISNTSKNDLRLDDIKIVVQSRDNDKINLRVDLTGEETQKAFDAVLTNLAGTAPPVPGFRRKKGGKTSNVPKSFLLQMLGRDRVTKFCIQEVVSITIGDYVKKENLKVKSQFKTIQTSEELEAAFAPGNDFNFDAVVDIDISDVEMATSVSS